MNVEEPAPPELPTTLFLVVSVIITVLVALFLAFSDDLQTRLPALVRPTAIVQSGATAAPTAPLPTATPSPSNTPDETAEPIQALTATPISIVAEVVCGNRPDGWQPMVAGPGDTVYTLSIISGATVGEIIQANCLEAGTVLSGMTVYLPLSPPTRTPCGPPQWWRSYVVRPGDTLYSLARRHGTTIYAIMQANCLVETKIFAGRNLYLPPIPATVPPPPPTIVPPSATPTATPTIPPSPTATADTTAVPTATATDIPPATETTTPSATATDNPTATVTATAEPTETAVPSSTSTLPPTATPPPTQAPTNTPQPTATDPPPETPQPE